MTEKIKRKSGKKPFIFDKEVLDTVEQLASQGLTQEQIAYRIGIRANTFSTKKNSNKELYDAIKRGQAKGLDVVTNVVFERAKNGDLVASMFYLKCRGGWREKEEAKNNVEVKIPELHVKLTDEKK